MTAFDTAWDLMKAPYHGTTTDVLPSIMREGIQPKRADPFTPPLVFYTNNPEQAMAFAKIRAEEEGRGEGWGPKIYGRIRSAGAPKGLQLIVRLSKHLMRAGPFDT